MIATFSRCSTSGAVTALVLTLTASSISSQSALADAEQVDLARFFSGHLNATGNVRNFSDGTTRNVAVDIHGKASGKSFTISMNSTYSDGRRERKIWTFQSLGNGRYVGMRADLVGTARVVAKGSQVRMSYVAKVNTPKGKTYTVSFNETYAFTAQGRGTNTVRATMFSIPVGDGHLTIRKLSD